MSATWKLVWRKELKDAARDKRSVMAAMSYALFGPLGMAVLFYMLITQFTSRDAVEIDIEGAANAPAFVEYLEQRDIIQREQPWDGNKRPITLEIPEHWNERMARAEPIDVILRADFSNQQQQAAIERVEQALDAYSGQIAQFRLQMRGLDPRLAQPLGVQKQDLATKGSRAAVIFGSVLVFILLSVFWSGMNVAIDTSAGERERNSLEFLLAQPLSANDIALGKALAAGSFAALGALLSLLVIPAVFAFLPFQELGMDINLPWSTALLMWVMLLPLALFASALQLFVSFRAKSFKEAQTYISFLLVVPMIASFGIEFARIKHAVLYYLPLTGQHQMFLDLIKGEPVNVLAAVACWIITGLLAVLLLRLIGRMLNSEKVVFGL